MQKNLETILRSELDPAFSRRARHILNKVADYKPRKILDAGCGRGFYLHSFTFFADIKEIHGFDISQKYLDIAKKNIKDKRVKIKKASIYKSGYPSNYFDFIVCSEVLEHLEKDKEALKELKRILNKNGTIIITVPQQNFPFFWDPLNWLLMNLFNTHINKDIWWLAGIWADHVRLYSLEQLKQVVKNAGLKIFYSETFVKWSWPFTHFLLYGIGKNLVERLNFKTADRFNFNKSGVIIPLIASFIALPSRLLDKRTGSASASNILMELRK